MSENTPEHAGLPVDVAGEVELTSRPSLVETVAVVGIVLGLVLGMAGVVALSWIGRDTPDVLDVSLGGLVGALAALLNPRRT